MSARTEYLLYSALFAFVVVTNYYKRRQQKQHSLIILQYGAQKSKLSLQGSSSYRSSRGEFILSCFLCLFLHLQTSASVITSLFLTLTPLPPPCVDIYFKDTEPILIRQENLKIPHLKILNAICKVPWPCKVTLSQVLGTRMWTSLGGIILSVGHPWWLRQ